MAVKRPTLGVSSLTAPVINLTGASFLFAQSYDTINITSCISTACASS